MSGFIAIAGLLTLAVLVALLYPLLRKREGSPEAWRSGGVAAIVVALGAAALYPLWSNFKWNEPEAAPDSPAAMVGRLARRLEKQPDDLNGWLLLGRSYAVIEQYPLAARAYQRADTLAKGQSAEALEGLAEALVNSGQSELTGRAGQLFEQAMELDPTSVKAIFYSAFAAAERNEPQLAKERFQKLLSGNPPPEVQQLISRQIAALDATIAMAGPSQSAGTGAAGSQPVSPQPGTATQPAATSPASVSLRVTLAAGVAGKAAPGAPLFVLARVPGQRGPPLAAKRLEARFPQDVELLATDAMIAGTGFTAGQQVEVEARIANGGGAISRSGDPFGTAQVTVGGGARVAVEINQLKP